MFWRERTGSPNVPELTTNQEYEDLLQRDLVIVFKHSPACGVSWVAHSEVIRFLRNQPDAPIYLVCVRRRRDLSRYIAQSTGVVHESPQILILRKGQVVGAASHDEITADSLLALLESV